MIEDWLDEEGCEWARSDRDTFPPLDLPPDYFNMRPLFFTPEFLQAWQEHVDEIEEYRSVLDELGYFNS